MIFHASGSKIKDSPMHKPLDLKPVIQTHVQKYQLLFFTNNKLKLVTDGWLLGNVVETRNCKGPPTINAPKVSSSRDVFNQKHVSVKINNRS